MIKRKFGPMARLITASVVLCAGLAFSAQPQGNTGQDSTAHANVYGKHRSTTHAQRMAAAENRAALMRIVKERQAGAAAMAADSIAPAPVKRTPKTIKVK